MAKKRNPDKGKPVQGPQRRRRSPVDIGVWARPEFEQVALLIAEKQYAEALAIAGQLAREHPDDPDAVALLATAASGAGELVTALLAADRLSELSPDDPEVHLIRATSLAGQGFAALALRAFTEVTQRFAGTPQAADAWKSASMLTEFLRRFMPEAGLRMPEDLPLIEADEQSQICLSRGDSAGCLAAVGRAMALRPGYAPARNIASDAHFAAGNTSAAIAEARGVLADDPGNVQAASNLTRFLLLSGDPAGAAEAGTRLRSLTPRRPNDYLRVAEALAFLGDDEGVLAVCPTGSRRTADWSPIMRAVLCHLAAVASSRLGNEDRARKLWREALRHNPACLLAERNLADSLAPAGRRNGAWSHSFQEWIPNSVLREIAAGAPPGADGGRLSEAIRKVAARRPELAALVPALLDRGDSDSRKFATMVAGALATPELHAALRSFAMGVRGSDDNRLEAAEVLTAARVIEPGEHEMHLEGRPCKTLLLGFNVTSEPTNPPPPALIGLLGRGREALNSGRFAAAERAFREVLQIAPGTPEAANNLAVALVRLGRGAEAEKVIRELFEARPDYLFARVAVARMTAQEGRYAEAEELLKPVMARAELHVSEFRALAEAQVFLNTRKGDAGRASVWGNLLARLDRDYSPAAAAPRVRSRRGRR
mgnify:CR=1 FL=1